MYNAAGNEGGSKKKSMKKLQRCCREIMRVAEEIDEERCCRNTLQREKDLEGWRCKGGHASNPRQHGRQLSRNFEAKVKPGMLRMQARRNLRKKVLQNLTRDRLVSLKKLKMGAWSLVGFERTPLLEAADASGVNEYLEMMGTSNAAIKEKKKKRSSMKKSKTTRNTALWAVSPTTY